jgi:hypothetical protein
MKTVSIALAIAGICASAAFAVDFNKDALKKMQEEGHNIVDQEQGLRALRLASNLCLHAAKPDKAGSKLQVAKCKPKSDNQKWQFDDKGRLATKGGVCLGIGGEAQKAGATAELQKCGGAKHQRWTLNDKGHLVNELGNCLQAAGQGTKAGAKLESRPCGKSPAQTWEQTTL